MTSSAKANMRRIGIGRMRSVSSGQIDIGWQFVQLLEFCGLAWDVQVPANLPPRQGITALVEGAEYVMNHADGRRLERTQQ
jgi:hypothetical protein